MLLVAISKINININILRESEDDDTGIITKSVLEDLMLSGDVTEGAANKFMELWLKTSEEKKGDLLEELISQLGPYKFKYGNLGYSRGSRIYNVGEDKKFDVIFYNKETAILYREKRIVFINGEIEFHECKKNVCNYVP